jgi:hypothetical protein
MSADPILNPQVYVLCGDQQGKRFCVAPHRCYVQSGIISLDGKHTTDSDASKEIKT